MIGRLNEEQIRHVLHSQLVGRIGCHSKDKVYIVPITYVYSNGYIYCHSKSGQKIDMMRDNKEVCFQVDILENMANWRSVIVWGEYEEFDNEKEKIDAMQLLADRVMPLLTSETVKDPSSLQLPHPIEKQLKAIPFRIKITEMTGRFEKMSN